MHSSDFLDKIHVTFEVTSIGGHLPGTIFLAFQTKPGQDFPHLGFRQVDSEQALGPTMIKAHWRRWLGNISSH